MAIMIPAALHLTVVHQLRVLCTIKIFLCMYASERVCVLRQRYYCYYLLVIMLPSAPSLSLPILSSDYLCQPLALSRTFSRFLFANFSMMPYLRCMSTFHIPSCVAVAVLFFFLAANWITNSNAWQWRIAPNKWQQIHKILCLGVHSSSQWRKVNIFKMVKQPQRD